MATYTAQTHFQLGEKKQNKNKKQTHASLANSSALPELMMWVLLDMCEEIIRQREDNDLLQCFH